jgi:hypothetical protein
MHMRHVLFPALLLAMAITAAGADLVPVLEVQTDFLIGSSRKGKWLKVEDSVKELRGGEAYRLYSATKLVGTSKGGKPESEGEPCPDVMKVPLKERGTDAVIAIGADWNALPRTPVFGSTTQPAYQKAAHDFLVAKGIKKPRVKVTQVVRIDLEGDGTEEVLVSATNYFSKDGSVPTGAPSGSYSFVILRREVKAAVKTNLVAGEFYPKSKNFNAPSQYEVLAVLDCDGDGKMEVIVEAGYYEGGWTTIYRCTPQMIEEVASVVCGA